MSGKRFKALRKKAREQTEGLPELHLVQWKQARSVPDQPPTIAAVNSIRSTRGLYRTLKRTS